MISTPVYTEYTHEKFFDLWANWEISTYVHVYVHVYVYMCVVHVCDGAHLMQER